jgi:hypothetical protein
MDDKVARRKSVTFHQIPPLDSQNDDQEMDKQEEPDFESEPADISSYATEDASMEPESLPDFGEPMEEEFNEQEIPAAPAEEEEDDLKPRKKSAKKVKTSKPAASVESSQPKKKRARTVLGGMSLPSIPLDISLGRIQGYS